MALLWALDAGPEDLSWFLAYDLFGPLHAPVELFLDLGMNPDAHADNLANSDQFKATSAVENAYHRTAAQTWARSVSFSRSDVVWIVNLNHPATGEFQGKRFEGLSNLQMTDLLDHWMRLIETNEYFLVGIIEQIVKNDYGR